MDAPTQKTGMEEPRAPVFDYIYQVAAFRDENSADSLRQKLEGYGYRTILQREGNLLLVQVRMRGSSQAEAEFVEVLRQLKLGNPILKSKTPVNP